MGSLTTSRKATVFPHLTLIADACRLIVKQDKYRSARVFDFFERNKCKVSAVGLAPERLGNWHCPISLLPQGVQLVAGDKRSAITGAQIIKTHPERMPAAICLASLQDAKIDFCLPVVFAALDHRLHAGIPPG